MFGQVAHQKEIPPSNILRVNIDQRLGSDAAQMTLTLSNQIQVSASTNLDLTHEGYTPSAVAGPSRRQLGDLGYPGYYTYNRGYAPVSMERWGHGVDPDWGDEFIPNRVIRTWQGYGTDGASNPWSDTKMTLTGTWLIDSVEYTSKGNIVISCRDLAKLLIEQRLFPPIIPLEHYPLKIWADHYDTVVGTKTVVKTIPGTTGTAAVEGANVAKFPSWSYNSSTAYWFADKYNRGACNHNPSHAFDNDPSTYWLSVSNNPGTASWAYEWIEADTQNEYINRVKFTTLWGGYQAFISVMVGGVWQGSSTIPYNPAQYGAPNHSNIKYVASTNIPGASKAEYVWDLPATYAAQRIRLTFHNLAYTSSCPTSVSSPHRAAVVQISAHMFTEQVTGTPDKTTEKILETTEEIFVPGNIRDYTDIVKLLCAWSGFFWPDQPLDWVIDTWSTFTTGRVWGDFEYSGAYPVEPPEIDESYWDNKSVMDGINQLKEILGFVFYIDSTGGAVWRSPNIWQKGNFITGVGYVPGEDTIESLDENDVLIDYGVTIDDESLRSEIIVVSNDQSDLLAISLQPGYAIGESSPETSLGDLRLLGGQERVMIVPDYPFVSQEEVIKFGYLTSLWMHWSYRKSKFRIPGNAAYEPDDQVRIYERTTSETYVHYLSGVSSDMDLQAGTWYLDIDTHWLGTGPDDRWVVSYTDIAENSPALMAFLAQNNRLDDGAAIAEGVDVDYWVKEAPSIPVVDWRSDPDTSMFPPVPDLGDYNPIYISEGSSPGGDVSAPTAGSYEGVRQYWGARCSNIGSTTLILAGDHASQTSTVRIQTHNKLKSSGVWRAVREVLIDQGLKVYPDRTGCYNCRKIAGSSKWSYHAWGIAIDINANLTSGWGIYDSNWPPPAAACQSLATAIKSRIKLGTTGKSIFYWGGDWTSLKDYMHFEVHVTPDQLDQHKVYLDGQYIWDAVVPGAE
jgi:hypothetical protein